MILAFILALSLGFQEAFPSDARLHFIRSSENKLEIHLQNDRSVAALQFTLNATGNVIFQSVSLSGRTADGTWTLSSFKTNDSVMNVVILRKHRNNLRPGGGAIAEIQFEVSDASSSHSVSFSHSVASTPAATGLDLDLGSIEWTTPTTEPFTLGQNYPNPFNPSTSIPFTLNQSTSITLTVYDVAGRQIKRITDGLMAAGNHTVTWNSVDESGVPVPSGIYFIALRAGEASQVRKVVLAR